METETNQFLGNERIGTLMKQYAVPCIISLLVGALYNIVRITLALTATRPTQWFFRLRSSLWRLPS